MLLQVQGLSKGFPALASAPAKDVLADVSLQVDVGERVGLIGPSGCGKTTLLSIIAKLESPDDGSVFREDETRISLMFQEPRLLPWRSVGDNLSIVLSGDDKARQVEAILDAVGLAESRHVFASRLSLGMARRVALARSFIVEPQLLLMDEPFVSLDAANALRLRRLLLMLLDRRKAGLLFVTHDLREAIMVCDRLVFLTSAPATIAFEARIDLDDQQRLDERIIEQKRTQLIAEHGLDTASLTTATMVN